MNIINYSYILKSSISMYLENKFQESIKYFLSFLFFEAEQNDIKISSTFQGLELGSLKFKGFQEISRSVQTLYLLFVAKVFWVQEDFPQNTYPLEYMFHLYHRLLQQSETTDKIEKNYNNLKNLKLLYILEDVSRNDKFK